MPRRHWSPRFAFAAAVDLDSAAGAPLFHRGGDSVVVSQRLHGDPIELFTGRCSRAGRSLPEEAISLGYVAGVDRDDRLFLRADFAFQVDPGAGNAVYGFAAAGQVSALVGGQHVVKATGDWRAGNIDARFTVTDGGGTATYPSVPGKANSLIDLMRSTAEDDDDVTASVTGCIEAADNAVYDDEDQRIRWGLDADGRAWSAWPASLDLPAPTITNSQLRRWLRVDGTETRQTITDNTGATYHYWAAARPAVWMLVPTRPAKVIERAFEVQMTGGRTRDGLNINHELSRTLSRRISWYVDGPNARSPMAEHTEQWLLNYGRFNLYQHWGEPRRAVPADLCDAATGSGPAPYDLVYTSERDGERGRIALSRGPKSFKGTLEYEGLHRARGVQDLVADVVWQAGARWPAL